MVRNEFLSRCLGLAVLSCGSHLLWLFNHNVLKSFYRAALIEKWPFNYNLYMREKINNGNHLTLFMS